MRRGRCVRCGKTTKETKAGLRECNACFEIRLKEERAPHLPRGWAETIGGEWRIPTSEYKP